MNFPVSVPNAKPNQLFFHRLFFVVESFIHRKSHSRFCQLCKTKVVELQNVKYNLVWHLATPTENQTSKQLLNSIYSDTNDACWNRRYGMILPKTFAFSTERFRWCYRKMSIVIYWVKFHAVPALTHWLSAIPSRSIRFSSRLHLRWQTRLKCIRQLECQLHRWWHRKCRLSNCHRCCHRRLTIRWLASTSLQRDSRTTLNWDATTIKRMQSCKVLRAVKRSSQHHTIRDEQNCHIRGFLNLCLNFDFDDVLAN